ncbi:hypothetical protein roselon_03107 [Roseibacterium elongatum DSM 19469]|uniref:Lipoprotein n=1 Tax=Roseicyclus elongatus DSM 19469 TaxID=1294273 RepID=W8RVR4_9RHOB|nr:hypothetical protein [Roseibacterium elongatum]AHM05378.1 hypothetical protein roselon_03107 [Roseibacterium elongatum DSM 19469]
MKRFTILLLCLGLMACGRPLTEGERAYMAELQGSTFAAAPVRIVENPLVGLGVQSYPARPQVTCRERLYPPPETDIVSGRTGGIALFNTLHVREDIFLEDYVGQRNGRRSLAAAMFIAHEMTHVWQWQNRAVTGYHPFRAFAEHARIEDPYLFDPDDTRRFLDYGYEQQASLVEEYVCCRAVDPQGARSVRLERLLGQVMPVTPLQSRADDIEEVIPWDGADLIGICS